MNLNLLKFYVLSCIFICYSVLIRCIMGSSPFRCCTANLEQSAWWRGSLSPFCWLPESFQLLFAQCVVCYRRTHPCVRHEKLNSVRPLNYKTQSSRPAYDSNIENKNSLVNKVDCRRRQDPPIFHTASASNTDRSSKWSKFLSNDVMDDCNRLVSNNEEGDKLYTTSILPSTVSTVFCIV